MKKTLLLFFCVGFLTSNEPSSDTDTEYWICHNLESEEHGNVCSDSCYESGNEHKFCWFLEKQRCLESGLSTEVQNACLIFEQFND